MGLYEGIKDVAKVIQKADNVDLYRQLIELSAQALDMQNEIVSLNAEISELKKSKNIEDRIERHSEPYITLKEDAEHVLYCARCWGHEGKMIQVKCIDTGKFKCTNCETHGTYDEAMHEAFLQRERASYQRLSESNRRNRW